MLGQSSSQYVTAHGPGRQDKFCFCSRSCDPVYVRMQHVISTASTLRPRPAAHPGEGGVQYVCEGGGGCRPDHMLQMHVRVHTCVHARISECTWAGQVCVLQIQEMHACTMCFRCKPCNQWCEVAQARMHACLGFRERTMHADVMYTSLHLACAAWSCLSWLIACICTCSLNVLHAGIQKAMLQAYIQLHAGTCAAACM